MTSMQLPGVFQLKNSGQTLLQQRFAVFFQIIRKNILAIHNNFVVKRNCCTKTKEKKR